MRNSLPVWLSWMVSEGGRGWESTKSIWKDPILTGVLKFLSISIQVKTLSENLKNIEDAEREQRWDATNQLQGLGFISEFEANEWLQVCDECLDEFCDGICAKMSFEDFKVIPLKSEPIISSHVVIDYQRTKLYRSDGSKNTVFSPEKWCLRKVLLREVRALWRFDSVACTCRFLHNITTLFLSSRNSFPRLYYFLSHASNIKHQMNAINMDFSNDYLFNCFCFHHREEVCY